MAGMNDTELSVLLSSYLDGELTKDELAIVVIALESDLDAIAEFRRLQAARRAVQTLPSLNVPLGLLPGGHLTEELSAYLDGELTTHEMPAVIDHLQACDDCRAELADLDRSRIAVRALPGLEPPAFLATRRDLSDARRRRRLWPAVAAAGSVAAAALVITLSMAGDDPAPAAISVEDLESRHTAVASVPAGATAVRVGNP